MVANLQSSTTRRTTPRWAVILLMAVVALTVAATVPVTRHARVTHETAALLHRLTDLVGRERDASWSALAFGSTAIAGAAQQAATVREARHLEIAALVAQAGPALAGGLAERVMAFQDLVDRQLEYLAQARPIAARELERLQVQAAYSALVQELDAALRQADAAAGTANAWESILLFAVALVAMATVIGLFVVLQRRNAALEFGAGRRAALEEEQRRLRSLIDSSADLIVVLGRDGRVRWASPSVSRLHGTPEEQMLGTAYADLIHPDDRPAMQQVLSGLATSDTHGPARFEARSMLQDGRARWMDVVATDQTREPGIVGIVLNATDITEQRAARVALEARERDLRELMTHVSGVFYRAEVGGEGRWTFVSPQIEPLLGYTADEWIADPDLWARSIHPDDRERVLREEDDPTTGAIDYRMITRIGELRWVRDDAAMLGPDDQGRRYWAGTLSDVTQTYLVEEDLRYRAHHDALTGLPNRSLLLDRLGNALDRSRRKPSDVGVIFIDLDDFKTVNDDHGHAAGDALLVAVAERLLTAIRPGDTAARLGGDEFALLVDEIDRQGLASVADRVIGALDEALELAGHQVHVTASVGVAISVGAGTDPERMLRDADTAMYVAKRQGKHRWVFFDPGMSGPQRQRVRMESDLRRALAHDEFHLVYQPVVRLMDGRIEGAEALLRWHSPELGTVDPDEFLGVAEESGLMVHIGHWVVRRACQDAAMWQRYSRRGLWLGVNISARQLMDPGMVASIAETLAETGLPPHQLVLEITEGAALRDLEAAEVRLGQLKAAGVRLAIDDFGSGTSSIGHLRRLAFDLIKIDRSLVADVHHSPEAQDLVRSLAHISRTLRAQPVAEGVEHRDQVQALRAAGCELGQGYLFARPMEAATLRDLFLPPESQAFVS